MNQPDRAKELYEYIRREYSGSLLNGQIPLGLIAGLEILKINQTIVTHQSFSMEALSNLIESESCSNIFSLSS